MVLTAAALAEDETSKLGPGNPAAPDTKSIDNRPLRERTEFQDLYRLIVYGQASLRQVRMALKTEDVGELVNVIHALYSMRWHRGVNGLLQAMWRQRQDKYPDLPWQQLEKTPSRIALASTINRGKIFDTQEYKIFIRDHKYDEHEFNRAQVVIALGLNADPVDIDYLHEMADDDNVYVSQSAVTALAIMNHVRARDSLIKLANKYKDTQRGQLMIEILKKAYYVVPTDDPSQAIQPG